MRHACLSLEVILHLHKPTFKMNNQMSVYAIWIFRTIITTAILSWLMPLGLFDSVPKLVPMIEEWNDPTLPYLAIDQFLSKKVKPCLKFLTEGDLSTG